MTKELNEDSGFKVSIKTLIAIGAAMATVIGMWFMLQADMINPSRIHRVKSSGTLEFDDAELTINGEALVLDRGTLELRDNELKIEELKLEGAGSEIIFGGYASNFLPVLLADSINSKDAKLRFKATLKIKQFRPRQISWIN